MSISTTVAPFLANSFAADRPMPSPAPVTIATLPLKLAMLLESFGKCGGAQCPDGRGVQKEPQKVVVPAGSCDELHADAARVRRHRDRNCRRGEASDVHPGGKNSVAARPCRLAADRRRKRFVRRPGERGGGGTEQHVETLEQRRRLHARIGRRRERV